MRKLRVKIGNEIICDGVLQMQVILMYDGRDRSHGEDAVLLGLVDAIIQAHSHLRRTGQQLGIDGLEKQLLSRLKHLRTIALTYARDLDSAREFKLAR